MQNMWEFSTCVHYSKMYLTLFFKNGIRTDSKLMYAVN